MKRLLISLVIFGSLLVPALNTHAAPAPSRVIGFTGKCLDADSNQGGTSGSTIQIWDCLTPGLNQKWIFDGGLIKSAAYPDKCLDVDSNQDGADGSKVQLYSCNNAANQRWKSQ